MMYPLKRKQSVCGVQFFPKRKWTQRLSFEIRDMAFGFWFGFALLLLGFSVERERELISTT